MTIIPLWAKLAAVGAILAGAWLAYDNWRDGIWQAGYDARSAEITAAALEANANAQQTEDARDQASESIADTTRAEAQQAVQAEQQTTAASAERVRTIIRTVEVPGNCPTTLPPEVEAEGRAAVARANGAGR